MKRVLKTIYRAGCLVSIWGILAAALPGEAAPLTGRPGYAQTVAGFGIVDISGVDFNLVTPGLISSDSLGHAYFTDADNNLVYRRDIWNVVDILAGNGLPGFGGDGGPASQARLNHPMGVASTPMAFLYEEGAAIYIADTGNHRIRKVTRNDGINPVSIITTLAGDGSANYKGDGGPATAAGFVSPEALAVNREGVIFVADRLDHRIRRFAPGGTITTYAGTGVPGFSGDGGPAKDAKIDSPSALYCDDDDNLYITDQGNKRIRKITPDGIITTLVGGGAREDDGGTGPETALHSPAGLAMNHETGVFYFVDGVRVRALVGGKVITVAGNGDTGWSGDNGPPLEASFRKPLGIAVPHTESLIINDVGQRRMRRIVGEDARSYIDIALGDQLWDENLPPSAKLTLPTAVLAAPDGRMLIADTGNRRIRSIGPPRNPELPREPFFIHTVAGLGESKLEAGASALNADLEPPIGLAGQIDGPYYFSAGKRVWKVDEAGLLQPVEIPGLQTPVGLALASDGRLYVADRDAGRIWIRDANGVTEVFAGSEPGDGGEGGPASAARLKGPEAVALGPGGTVYIADTGNHKIRRVDPDGSFHTVAGTGIAGIAPDGDARSAPLASPEGVAVDTDGTVYVSDTMNHRIVRITQAGKLETVAGGSQPGQPVRDYVRGDDVEEWSGAARFYEPAGLAFDGSGNLYIADRRNHRIRALFQAARASAGPPPTLAGDLNHDDKINIRDVILALQIVAKIVTPTDEQKSLADVAPSPGIQRPYGDGRVDISDIIRLIKRSVGLIPDAQWP